MNCHRFDTQTNQISSALASDREMYSGQFSKCGENKFPVEANQAFIQSVMGNGKLKMG